jgi:hypothetical protein
MAKLLVRITLLKLLVRIEFSTVCAFDACAVQYSAPWLPAKLFIDVTDSMWQPSQAAATGVFMKQSLLAHLTVSNMTESNMTDSHMTVSNLAVANITFSNMAVSDITVFTTWQLVPSPKYQVLNLPTKTKIICWHA